MSRKILVIDDEVSIGELIRDYLEGDGYDVWIATDIDEGLQVIAQEQPALVMLDVMLPGIGGVECLRQIKKRYPQTIVVMLSGLHDEETAKTSIRYGAYDYVTKPFNLEFFQANILSRVFPASNGR